MIKTATHLPEHLLVEFLVELLHSIETKGNTSSRDDVEEKYVVDYQTMVNERMEFFAKFLVVSGEFYGGVFLEELRAFQPENAGKVESKYKYLKGKTVLGSCIDLDYGGKSKTCLLKNL